MLLKISGILFEILYALIFVKLLRNTLIKRSIKNNRYEILGAVILSLIFVGVEFCPYINGYLAKPLCLISFMVFATIFYSNRLVENVIISFIYSITYMFIGYPIRLIFEDIKNQGWITENMFGIAVGLAMTIIAYFVMEKVLTNILDYKNYSLKKSEFIGLFFFCTIGFVCISFFSGYMNTIIGTVSVVSVLMSSALIKIIREKEEKEILVNEKNELKEQNELIKQSAQKKYESCQRSREADEHLLKVSHDMMHHYNYLLDCTEEMRRYIYGLKGVVKESASYFNTGSSMLDLILEERCREAEKFNIQFRVIGDFSEGLKLEAPSVSIVFGNLFNNAIEGCNRLPSDALKKISTTFYQEPHKELCIKMSNTAITDGLIIKDGKIETTKEDKERHGIGLDSVRDEISKYGGSVVVSAENGIFTVEIRVPLD